MFDAEGSHLLSYCGDETFHASNHFPPPRCALDADWGVHGCAMMESTKRRLLITPEGEVYLKENGGAVA